jgi:hypothetical protein
MTRLKTLLTVCTLLLSLLAGILPAQGQWVTRHQPTAPPCS